MVYGLHLVQRQIADVITEALLRVKGLHLRTESK